MTWDLANKITLLVLVLGLIAYVAFMLWPPKPKAHAPKLATPVPPTPSPPAAFAERSMTPTPAPSQSTPRLTTLPPLVHSTTSTR